MDRKLDNIILIIIGIALVILLFLTFKVYNIYKGGSSGETTEAVVDATENTNLADDQETYIADEDAADDELTTEVTTDANSEDEDDDSASQEDEEVAESNDSSSSNTVDSGGKFMIIAGNYSSKGNAETQAATVRAKGYEPEVVQFVNSKLHSVCVARYDDKDDANREVEILKRKYGINSYVHKRKGRQN